MSNWRNPPDKDAVIFLDEPLEDEIFTLQHVVLSSFEMEFIQTIIDGEIAHNVFIRPDEAMSIAMYYLPSIRENNPYINDEHWAVYLQYIFRKKYRFESDGWQIYKLEDN